MSLALHLLAQYNQSPGGNPAAPGGTAGSVAIFLIELALLILALAGLWKAFEKAGEPGWAAIIPIYNVIVWLRVAGKPWWWILLFLIPFVNIVLGFIVAIAIANNFGKGAGFGVGLALLGFIFYPILAWSDATYQA